MRAIFGGPISLAELPGEIEKFIDNLEANGVEDLNHLYLYFTPRLAGRTRRFYSESGVEVDTLRFDDPNPSPFVPVTDDVRVESKGDDQIQI